MATALVTGASAGLGEEFAWQLATAGHDLVVTARSGDRLSELADVVSSATGVSVEVLVADLAAADGREAVATRLAGTSGSKQPVSLLVNNAGFGTGTDFVDTPWEEEAAMHDVLVTAPLRLTHAVLPGMIERGHGAVLNVSSIAAHLSNSTYAAHKRWLLEFTESLAGQLRGTGVTATAVLPGLTRTAFHDRPALQHHRADSPEFMWLDAEQVVSAALTGVRRGSVSVTPSVRYSVAGAFAQLAPASVTRGFRSMRTQR
jgi:short-subunit dehydrogenase